MSQLYDLRVLIENKIKADGLEALKVKGQIALITGRTLALSTPNTSDEPDAVAKPKKAAKDILNISVWGAPDEMELDSN